jgi:hypothetical protein
MAAEAGGVGVVGALISAITDSISSARDGTVLLLGGWA